MSGVGPRGAAPVGRVAAFVPIDAPHGVPPTGSRSRS
jgi:hypothetical protein